MSQKIIKKRIQIIFNILTTVHECRSVISTEKTMALDPCIVPLTTFPIGEHEFDMCHKYKYLQVNVNDVNKTQVKKISFSVLH